MPRREFKFPLALLTRQAGRLKNALDDATTGPPVAARLPASFVRDYGALLTKVGGAPAAKAGQAGETGTLTIEQDNALREMLRLMSAARRTAGLAFKGNDVVLREEFQVGVFEPQGLGDEVKRAGIIAASCTKYTEQLGAEGWTADETTKLQTAIGTLSGADVVQEASKAKGPGMTSVSNADANKLYRNCLTIQNAARLQFPSTEPGNETPRARYLIGEFPPHGHSDTGEAPPDNPPPTPPPSP